MPDTRTDGQLMGEFYAGGQATATIAFTELVQRWKGRLYRFFKRKTCSHEQAEDLVQIAFVKIYSTKERHHGRYEPNKSFDSWIYGVAGNAAIDAYRREKRRPTTVLPENVVDKTPPPVDEGLSDDLSKCLQELPEREKTFLLLWEKAFGELSQSEVAEVLDLSNATVHRIMLSALEDLRACLTRRAEK